MEPAPHPVPPGETIFSPADAEEDENQKGNFMKSFELLRDIFKKHGVKKIAPAMGTAVSSLYKWCQPDGGKSAGGWNPLERVASLMRVTGDLRPLHWLCEQFGGYFVLNPKGKSQHPAALLPAENRVIHEFADLIGLITQAVKDGKITSVEARGIRAEWERLKSVTEGFVSECEEGDFQSLRTATKLTQTATASVNGEIEPTGTR